MAQHDYRNPDDDRDDRRRGPGQMDQYADSNRQYGGQPFRGREAHGQGQRDAGNWGAPQRRDEGLQNADAAQTSYGRYGAPDIHGQPSGGYTRPVYEPARHAYGQYERGGYGGPRGAEDEGGGRYGSQGGYGGYGSSGSWRQEGYGEDPYAGRGNQGYQSSQSAYGYGYDDGRDRYQGGAGGYRSNAGPYAGSQRYGGTGDQLGYGSGPGYGYGCGGREQHHDPDYRQWREQQLRNLDEDYASWRGERYKKFSDEFDAWRKNRSSSSGGSSSEGGGHEASGKTQRAGASSSGTASGGTGQAGGSGTK